MNTALRLLSRRDHSSVELARKLAQRGFEAADIATALAECERLNYLDDRKVCDQIVAQQRRKGCGILRITQALRDKGIATAQIDSSLRRDCCEMNQIADCRRALAKKLKMKAFENKADAKEHLYRFLQSRGFVTATIRDVLFEEFPTNAEPP